MNGMEMLFRSMTSSFGIKPEEVIATFEEIRQVAAYVATTAAETKRQLDRMEQILLTIRHNTSGATVDTDESDRLMITEIGRIVAEKYGDINGGE